MAAASPSPEDCAQQSHSEKRDAQECKAPPVRAEVTIYEEIDERHAKNEQESA